MADPDDDDYVYFGTSLEDEVESHAGQRRKEVHDAAQMRALPVHQQEVTDEEGRRRFHGAFTGGYSAGYYNTVGSAEGWTPSAFTSSRASRAAARPQTASEFMDEDELAEAATKQLRSAAGFDTFGADAASAARRAAAEEAAARPSAIPGMPIEDIIAPVTESIGVQLLQKMGWRPGKGIGQALGGGAGGRWGRVAGVGVENTGLWLLDTKTDVHGLGFDPFKGAEEFRAAAAQRKRAAGEAHEPGLPRKRARGVAFGAGVLDEDDSYGMMDDYVAHGADEEAGPRAGAAFHYEIASEEEDEHEGGLQGVLRRDGGGSHTYRLPSSTAPPLQLKSAAHYKKPGAFIPGFVPEVQTAHTQFYPPPTVPPEYNERHEPPPKPAPEPPSALAGEPVEAPPDAALRHAIDTLSAFVARNGPAFEEVARRRHAGEPLFDFLRGGPGAGYYAWRLRQLRSQQQAPKPGQRSAPLTADERGELLGEQRLPATQQLPPPPAPAAAAAQGEAAGGAGPRDRGRVSLLQIADADRQRLTAALGGMFVKADSQDMQGATDGAAPVPGLRPGYKKLPPPPPAPAPAPGAAASHLGGMGDRFANGGTEAPAMDKGGLSAAPRVPGAAAGRAAPATPKRRVEDWRPAPLLCKRLNVADPYKGRPLELQMSKFKADYIALPETVAALTAAATAAAEQQQQQQLPPPPPVQAARALPPPPPPPGSHQQRPPRDSAALADDFLGSLGVPPPMPPPPPRPHVGGAAGQTTVRQAPAAPSGAGAAGAGAAAARKSEEGAVDYVLEKPMDLFKAIFEASDSDAEAGEEEEEEKEEAATGAMPPPPPRAPTSGGHAWPGAMLPPPPRAPVAGGQGDATEALPVQPHAGAIGIAGTAAAARGEVDAAAGAVSRGDRDVDRGDSGKRATVSGRSDDGSDKRSGGTAAHDAQRQQVLSILEALRASKGKKKKKRKKKEKEKEKEKDKHGKKEGRLKKAKKHKKGRKSKDDGNKKRGKEAHRSGSDSSTSSGTSEETD